jgi:O-antigen ligase
MIKVKWMFALLFTSIFIHNIPFDFFNNGLRLYMVLSLISTMFLLSTLKARVLLSHEVLLIALYMYMSLSILWTPNVELAIKMLFGQIVIIFSYFSYTILIDRISLSDIEKVILIIGKWLVFSSLVSYVIGLYYINDASFNLADIPTLYNSDKVNKVFGVYLSGGYLPRLSGFADSPNNFVYYFTPLMILFFFKKKRLWSLLTCILLIATFSGTFYVILSMLIFVYLLMSLQLFKVLLMLSISIILLLNVVNSSDMILEFFIYRMDRMLTGSGRFELWGLSLDYIYDKPIFGYGLNQSREVLSSYRNIQSTHNTFLEAWIFSGLGAVLLYSLFYVYILKSSLQVLKVSGVVIPLFVFISFSVFIMGNNSLHIDPYYYIIFYIYASKIGRHVSK